MTRQTCTCQTDQHGLQRSQDVNIACGFSGLIATCRVVVAGLKILGFGAEAATDADRHRSRRPPRDNRGTATNRHRGPVPGRSTTAIQRYGLNLPRIVVSNRFTRDIKIQGMDILEYVFQK